MNSALLSDRYRLNYSSDGTGRILLDSSDGLTKWNGEHITCIIAELVDPVTSDIVQ